MSGVKLDLVPPPSSVLSSEEERKKKSSSDDDDNNEEVDSVAPLILQPPEDERLGDAAAIHYTWGTRIVEVEGEEEGENGEEEKEEEGGGGGTAAAAATTTGKASPSSSSSSSSERLVWEFDKRKTTEASAVELLPRPRALPQEFSPRWRLAGSSQSGGGGERGQGRSSWKRGKRVSRELFETLTAQVREINACIDWLQAREEEKEKVAAAGGGLVK